MIRSTNLARSSGPLPWLGWSFSLLLPIAIVLLVITFFMSNDNQPVVEFAVEDEAGRPLPDTYVSMDHALYLTDEDGMVRLLVNDTTENVTIEREGFVTMVGEINSSSRSFLPITLQRVSNVAQSIPTNNDQSTKQDDNQMAAASTPNASMSKTPTAKTPSTDEVAGTIANTDGEPIAQAWVTDGEHFAFSDNSGVFLFDKGTVDLDATLTSFGSGYKQRDINVSNGSPLDIELERQPIKGIYYNPNISRTEEDVDELIRIANTTEINAIVVDIKEELVFYDTHVQFFKDADVVAPIINLSETLKKFHDNGIYTIARLVVFKDGAVAKKYPYLGIMDNITGELWQDMNGVVWVNPMLHELWDYNIRLAREAATMGFDEIQYDYVRFPTDGDLSRVEYGIPNTQENRQNAIEGLLEKTRQALIPTRTPLSADIFGYTVKTNDDLGIGQNVSRLASHVDYLSPMVYPSHWPSEAVPVDGHPNDSPYETIHYSMELALDHLDGDALRLRPWLQDFSMPGMMEYGAPEVRAQIDAVEDLGLSSWLIWDPNNWYHEDAFEPTTRSATLTQATLAATPQATTRGSGSKTRRGQTQ